VSEHIAFVRSGGLDSGHLLPVPRRRDVLEVLVDNVGRAVERLPVPLALEPIATLFEWPDAQMTESEFLCELLERTGALLLLDVANVHANAHNHGHDAGVLFDALPHDRIAYVHVAGGLERGDLYHDTHGHPVHRSVIDLLQDLGNRGPVPGVMLERDDNFPPPPVLGAELDAISDVARLAPAAELPALVCHRSSVPASRRSALAREQTALVRALLGRGPIPDGFDPARIDAAAAAVKRKRARWHRHEPRWRPRTTRARFEVVPR
jgi:uncharacterized protein